MRKTLLILLLLNVLVEPVFAATPKPQQPLGHKVMWDDYREFTDIKPANGITAKYAANIQQRLGQYLLKLTARLPAGQTLRITVNDVDLAGRVWPASFVGMGHEIGDVRYIKSIDIPRFMLSYQLLDETGKTIQSDERVAIKDMNFQHRANGFFKSDNLRYEKNLLLDWFENTFLAN